MRAPLKILLVEDSPDDAELLLRHLRRDGLTITAERVETRAQMEAMLHAGPFDVVVSDFGLPAFSGLEAVVVARDFDADLPVILVSGTVGEESAAEVMRVGARDFVLKGSLSRLVLAMEREVREAKLRRSQRREGKLLLRTQAIARAGGWEWSRATNELFWTAGAARVLAVPEDEPPSLALALARLAPGEFDRLRAVLGSGVQELDLDLRVTSTEGRELLVRVVARVERSPDGKVQSLVGALQDVTERRQLESNVRLQDRLVAMGTVAAGVAHEINNPLTHLVASLPMVIEATRGAELTDPEVPAMLQGCLEAARRIAAVVRDLKLLSRPDETAAHCDLAEVLTSVLNLLNLEYRHAARIRHEIPPGVIVAAPSARIAQVLTNLVINAVQAMPARPAAENLVVIGARAEGRTAALTVTDNGAGIPPSVKARLFTPFFTTKPVGLGTGLGLSVCRDIAVGLGGDVTVESTPGEGTTFLVRLPLAVVVRTPGDHGSVASFGRRLRLLVIDDEPLLRATARRVLRPHEVIEADCVDAGLALLAADASFDAVLCDLMMPDKQGMDFYREVCAHFPVLASRCLFVSGGAVSREAEAFLDSIPHDRLVLKPFTGEQLRAAIHQVVSE